MNPFGGSLYLILGPMFSGKTTELSRRLKVELDTGATVLYINHKRDVRNGASHISTHNGQLAHDRDGIPKIRVETLQEVDMLVKSHDVVGVDESQFFSDLEDCVRRWVLNYGKTVIVSGLNGDSNMKIFGDIYKLMPLCAAGQLSLLGARCTDCIALGKKRGECIGSFTAMTDTSNVDGNVKIGGKEAYVTVCMECHQKRSKTVMVTIDNMVDDK
jgi:thymidine kinase